MYEELAKLLRFIFLVYYVVSIFYRILFLENFSVFSVSGAEVFFDYLPDLFYLVDLLVTIPRRSNVVHPLGPSPTQSQAQVSKAIHRQTLVIPSHGTAKLYNRKYDGSGFTVVGAIAKYIPHIIMIFPFEVVGVVGGMRAYYMLRSVRLVRLCYFYSYWQDVSDMLRKYQLCTSAGAQRVILFTILLAVVGHVAACMFYNIAVNHLRHGISNNWLVHDGLAQMSDDRSTYTFLRGAPYRYVRALYWSYQTLTTVGFGDVAAWSQSETWFTVFYFLVIALLVTLTLANLTMAVTNYDAAHTENLKKIYRFEKYAAYHRLPPALTNRVVSYYEHQWKKLRGLDERLIHSELPSRLRNKVVHHVIRDKLLVLPALRTMNKSCLNAITAKVESYVYSPQDVIISEGGAVTGVHIIAEGTVQRSHAKSVGLPLELQAGELFGEKGLLENHPSPHSYAAKEYSEVLFLPGPTFRHLCQLYLTAPEIDSLISTLNQLSVETSAARVSVKSPFVKVTRRSVFGPKTILRRVTHQVKTTKFTALYSAMMAPNSIFRMWWGVLIFCGITYYAITVGLLLQATLRQDFAAHYYGMLVAGYIVDVAFLLDAVMEACCFAFDRNGVIVTDSKSIFEAYLARPYSLPMLFATFPWDLVFGLAVNLRVIPVLRLLKLAHLVRFDQSFSLIVDLLFAYGGISVSFELGRFVYLYTLLFLVCHWCGCLWTVVAEVSTKIFGYETSWRQVDTHNGFFALNYQSLSGSTVYWREIYWTVNVMSSIGWATMQPTNPVEYIGMSALLFIGYLLFTTLMGALSSLMGSFNSAEHEFNTKVDKIRHLVRYKNVSKPIEQRLVRYYEYVWARYGGIDETAVLRDLPKSLRASVANHVIGPLVRRIPFFDCCSQPMEQMLVSLFESRIFLEGDALMLCGEVGQDMFIIAKGEVEITSADRSRVFAKLKDGDYVGEGCFLQLSKRTASAYALDYVDTYFLTRDNFLKAAEKFPGEYDVVVEAINETLRIKEERNESVASGPRTGSFIQKEAKRQSLFRENSEQEETEAVAKAGTIHPESDLKMLWDVGISLTLLYYAVVIPLRITLNLSEHLFLVDYAFDVVNVYENYLHMAVFAVYARGELMVSHRLIRAHYFRTRFLGDLVCSLPYDLIALACLGYSREKLLLIRALLRLPKLLRLRLGSVYFGQCKRLAQKLGVNSLLMVLIELICSVLLVMHWVGCVFYMFAEFGGHPGSCVNEPGAYYGTACRYRDTWVGEQIAALTIPKDGGTQWLRLLAAEYWALSTVVAVSMGDIVTMSNAEVVFCFFVTFFGLCVSGMIIGSVMNLVHDASDDSNKVYRTMEVMQAYLVANNVPAELVTRAVAQMQHLSTTEGLLLANQTAIFSDLPHSLKLAIDNQVKTIPYLRRCPIFDFCSEEILRGISARLRVQFNVKGDKIINGGELGHEMFFVESGSVDVMNADCSVHYTTLEVGAFFGETALFFRTVRSATVVVSSPFCVCLRLSRADLENELRVADYDPIHVIDAFKSLQTSNERRNRAVTANLARTKDPHSKLFKMIKPTEAGREKETWLHMLRRTLSPSSTFRMCWDVVGLLLLVYYAVSIVFYIAFFFGPKLELYLRFIAFDFLIDLFWVLDIALKACVFSYKPDAMQDRVVTDGEQIWRHYRDDGYFRLDAVASIPFEFLALIPGSSRAVIFACRLNHMLRVWQLGDYASLMETHLQEKLGFTLSRATWYLLRFAVLYLFLCHWLTCGYFMIHRYAERHVARTYVTVDAMATWDPATGQHDICSFTLSYCYARTLYFVVGTVTGIGYGDIAPRTALEIFYQMLTIVVVMFIISTFHGICVVFLEEHDAKSVDVFNAKIQTLQNYIAYRQLPKTDGDAILAQYTHMWRKVKSTKAEGNEVLGMLSQSTMMDLSLHLQAGILKAVPLLDDLAVHAKRRIAAVLHPQIAMADTYLYRAGDSGECIFFMSHGSVQLELGSDLSLLDSRSLSALQILLHKQSVCGSVYVAGDHFGEYCVVSHAGLRPESSKVLTGSEVYALSRADLWAVFQFLTYSERRCFLYELMTRVGERRHITKRMDSTTPSAGQVSELMDDTRMKALYRLAYDVMTEVVDDLNPAELLRSQDGDDAQQAALKRTLRARVSNADKFTQRDLIDLFEKDSAALPNAQLTFTETALRSRVSSFNHSVDSGDEARDFVRPYGTSFTLAQGESSPRPSRPQGKSISHLLETRVPNLTFAHTMSTAVMDPQDSDLHDVDSLPDDSSTEDEEDEGAAAAGQGGTAKSGKEEDRFTPTRFVSAIESRRRSTSQSFVQQRIRALSSGFGISDKDRDKEREREKEVEMRSPSPALSRARSVSGSKMDAAGRGAPSPGLDDAGIPSPPDGTPSSKTLVLRRRSVIGDYYVVKNALEIERHVGKRRGSLIIGDGTPQS